MTLIFKLLLQLLAVVSALLTSALDYVAHDKRTRHFKSLRTLLFVVVGLSLLASLVVTIEDEIAKKQEVAALQGELAAIRNGVQRSIDAVTGGSSFPYLNLLGEQVILVNEGSDPLYDISVRMWDPSDYKSKLSEDQLVKLEAQAVYISVVNMPPHSTKFVARVPLPPQPFKVLEASIIARNGSFSEQLVRRYIEGTWRIAYRVFWGFDRNNAAKLLERSDPIFPRDKEGEPLWEEVAATQDLKAVGQAHR